MSPEDRAVEFLPGFALRKDLKTIIRFGPRREQILPARAHMLFPHTLIICSSLQLFPYYPVRDVRCPDRSDVQLVHRTRFRSVTDKLLITMQPFAIFQL